MIGPIQVGGSYIRNTRQKSGPFQIGGNLYVVENDRATVYKSTDAGATWNTVDYAHRPAGSSPATGQNEQGRVAVAVEGTTIHIAYATDATSYQIAFVPFDTLTDTYGAASPAFTVGTSLSGSGGQYIRAFFIGVRTDGTKQIVYSESSKLWVRTWTYAGAGSALEIATGLTDPSILTLFAADDLHLAVADYEGPDCYYIRYSTSATTPALMCSTADGFGTAYTRVGTITYWSAKAYLPYVQDGTHALAIASGTEAGFTSHTFTGTAPQYDHAGWNFIAATPGSDGKLYLAWETYAAATTDKNQIDVTRTADGTSWATPVVLLDQATSGPTSYYYHNLAISLIDSGNTLAAIFDVVDCTYTFYVSVPVADLAFDDEGGGGGGDTPAEITGTIAVSSAPSFQAAGNVEGGGLGVESVEIDCSITIFPSSVVTPGTCLWIDLWVWRQLTSFSTLDQNVALPPGYQKALTLALAVAIASEYKRLPHPKVVELADKAKAAIEALNSSNHVAQEDPPDA